MTAPPGRDDDAGFTLVELLIALTIGSMLIGVLGTTLVLGFRTYAGIQNQLEDASRTQSAAGRFLTDAQSAEVVRTTPQCAGSGDLLLGLSWNLGDPEAVDAGASAVDVDWALLDGEVVRRICGAVSGEPAVMLRRVTSIELGCQPASCSATWTLEGPPERSDAIDVVRRPDPRSGP